MVQMVFGVIFNEDECFVCDGLQFDWLMVDGECFMFGEIEGMVFYIFGYMLVCMVWIIGDVLFIGDILFMFDYGIVCVDFFGGDVCIFYCLIQCLLLFFGEMWLFFCYDYKVLDCDSFVWEMMIVVECIVNVYVYEGVDEDQFVVMCEVCDKMLLMLWLIFLLIQVNMCVGYFFEFEVNGI